MMKKTLRYALFLMAILLAVGALFGCGAKAMVESDDAYRNHDAESPTYSYNGKGESWTFPSNRRPRRSARAAARSTSARSIPPVR